MSQLFIPEKIKVGYQKRKGTYTGRLAYVIYYGADGKLRKERSWQNWRDHKIEPDEFENIPTEGFVLNKDVQRCNWSHFGSGRSYIRVYDPRGIEFEVTPENLIGILMESDCNKRGLVGEFIYAWNGIELLLLPCVSESYTTAKKYTALQGKKVSARDLKPGCSYTTKDNKELIYLGRFLWHTWKNDYRTHTVRRTKRTKRHIFWNGKDFLPLTNMSKLAQLNSEEPVQQYAELIDKFKDDVRAQTIVSVETKRERPTDLIFKKDKYGYTQYSLTFLQEQDDIITSKSVRVHNPYQGQKGFIIDEDSTVLHTKDQSFTSVQGRYTGYSTYPHGRNTIYDKETVLKLLKNSVKVFFVMESGKKHELTNLNTWSLPGGCY